MNIIRYKIPLLMYSDTERDPKDSNSCLIRKMEDLEDISQVSGIEKLGGQYCWIYDYDTYCSHYTEEEVDKFYEDYRKSNGFCLRDVLMSVTFKDGYYLAEFLTELPLDKEVVLIHGHGKWRREYRMTLKKAIKDFLDGHLSDGIGENPIGYVSYNYTTHEVTLGDAEEITN